MVISLNLSLFQVMSKVIPVRRSGPEMDGGMDLTAAPDLAPTDEDEF